MSSRNLFGLTPDGAAVDVFTISNAHGIEVRAITLGCIIVSLVTPDRDGAPGDVVLGFDALEPYLTQTSYFGAVVGRYANRIAAARFSLDGRTYQLAANNGANHLHGGRRGFDKQLWHGEEIHRPNGDGIVFSRTSPDGEEGYPGNLRCQVTYVLTSDDELAIEYEAETDAPTIVNLTQHSYFDLACGAAHGVLGHRLTIDADRFTPIDAALIPTGELAAVEGTPFDFREPITIGARIDAADAQLRYGEGYDHNWVLSHRAGELTRAARLEEPLSGRVLEVVTTEPGIQFYSGNQLDGSIVGKGGRRYDMRSGLCLETQHFPDSPNHPLFPSPVLRPGTPYRSRTIFRFSTARV